MSPKAIVLQDTRQALRRTAQSLTVPVLSVLASFVVGGLLIASIRVNPFGAYWSLFQGAFGGAYSFGDSLVKMTPLIFTGLSVAFARRCGMLSIGAEGQLYAGAVGATIVALQLGERGHPRARPC